MNAERWYSRAEVRRASPLPTSLSWDDTAGVCFAREAAPHATHPLAEKQGQDAVRALLRKALVRYLHGTSVLEIRVVNPVAADVAHGGLGWDFDQNTRVLALALTTDEGYHALRASELLASLGANEAHEPAPVFCERLDRLLDSSGQSAGEQRLLRFLFTVVTETVISANLKHLATNAAVCAPVRAFVAEHSRDEAWHGAFFAKLLLERWPVLAPSEQRRLGEQIPSLLAAFLEPDRDRIVADLTSVGLSAAQAEGVFEEAYGTEAWRAEMSRAARPALSCFQRAHVFPEHVS